MLVGAGRGGNCMHIPGEGLREQNENREKKKPSENHSEKAQISSKQGSGISSHAWHAHIKPECCAGGGYLGAVGKDVDVLGRSTGQHSSNHNTHAAQHGGEEAGKG